MIEVNEKNAGTVAKALKEGVLVGPSTVRRTPAIAQLAAALLKVQAAIEDPSKGKTATAGTRGTYRYADLPDVLNVVRPALTANGLVVMQFPSELDGDPALTTLLAHTSGEWVETTFRLRPVGTDPQKVGSALTYIRRYSLLAVCGIAADDDDDGRAASTPAAKPLYEPEFVRVSLALRDTLTRLFVAAATLEQWKAAVEQVDPKRLTAADLEAVRRSAADAKTRVSPQQQPAAAGK